MELDHIRDPAKVPGHEVFQVRSELPDAPLYHCCELHCLQDLVRGIKMRRVSVAVQMLLFCVVIGWRGQQGLPEYTGIADTLDQQARQGVTPENNAAARLCEVVELYQDSYRVKLRERLEFHRRIGVPAAGSETPRLQNFFKFEWEFRDLEQVLSQIDVRFQLPEFFHEGLSAAGPVSADMSRLHLDSVAWTARQHPLAASWVRSQEPVLQVIRDAAARSHWYLPIIASKSDSGSVDTVMWRTEFHGNMTEVFEILRMAAMLRLGEQQVQAAWTELRALLRLSRHLQSESDVGFLTGLAMESVASARCLELLSLPNLSEADIDGFLADLQALPAPGDPLLHAEQYSRPVMFELLEFLRRDERQRLLVLTDPLADNEAERRLEQVLRKHSDIDWTAVERRVSEEYDRWQQRFQSGDLPQAVQSMREAVDQWEHLLSAAKSALETGKSTSRETVAEYVTFRMLVMGPAEIQYLQRFSLGTRIQRSLLLTSCWLRKYQLRTGDWPETPGAVEQLFGCRLPADPMHGAALGYRRVGSAIRLYSVGKNGSDDGGERNSDDVVHRQPFMSVRAARLPLAP